MFFKISKVACVCLMLCGCHVPSKVALEGNGGRSAYNIAIQKTNNEEILLNLVRIRYYDAPFFLELGNVTTQYTYKAQANPAFTIPGFNTNSPFSLGGEFSWQNQPTLQYSPLEGHEFSKQLMQPITLGTIQKLIYSGWDVDRIFRLIIQSVDELTNSPMGTNPAFYDVSLYKSFYRATQLMRYFQLKGSLQMGLRSTIVKPSQAGEPKEHEEEILQISFPANDEKSKELAALLGGIKQINNKYILNMLQGFDEKGIIGVMSRSLLSCFFYLSQSVEVPIKDEEKGLVAVPQGCKKEDVEEWHKAIETLLVVHSSYAKPANVYISIKYRDCWFYIADDDLTSKRTFVLLQQLFNLQAGEPKKDPPLLSLPLG
jgi:hypothetical protein